MGKPDFWNLIRFGELRNKEIKEESVRYLQLLSRDLFTLAVSLKQRGSYHALLYTQPSLNLSSYKCSLPLLVGLRVSDTSS